MADCMRAVDGLDIKPRGRKRKVTYKEEPDSQSGKEAASTSSQELPPLPRPSVPSRHVPILPRPSSTESRESPSSQPPAPLPKRKRGRPMYSGREASGHQPALLRHIAPKPSDELRREQPRQLQPANGPAPRAILPKVYREGPYQGAVPPSSQVPHAQQLGVGPAATSYYPPISTNPRPAVARRNARRQLLGLENGIQVSQETYLCFQIKLMPLGTRGPEITRALTSSTSIPWWGTASDRRRCLIGVQTSAQR